MFGSQIAPFLSAISGSTHRHHFIRRHLSPFQAVTLGFVVMILIGAFLLYLPISQQAGKHVSLLNCLFTATSAVSVTGLVTVSTADTWTRFGQTVILFLMQVGGLGYMTFATIAALVLGLRVGLRARLQLKDIQGVLTLRDAVQIIRYAVIGTLIIEGLGTIFLALRFHYHHGYTWTRSLFDGVFYSISSFCNAGFDLAPGFRGFTLSQYRLDPYLLFIIGCLVVLGGLGFGVIAEIISFRHIKRLSLHTKIVVTVTIFLIVLGTCGIFLFEGSNPNTLASLHTPWQRITTSAFMAVTPRTAGFSPIDLTQATPPTLFFLSMLMFIGASPGSTGGGVKTTTIAVILLAVIALVRKRSDIEAYHRRISGQMVRLALSLVSMYLLTVFLVIIGVSIAEITQHGLASSAETAQLFNRIVFEVFSAFGSVGLSTGITPTLEPVSRVLIMVGMFLGRLGPLAFVYIYGQPKAPLARRFPAESIMTG